MKNQTNYNTKQKQLIFSCIEKNKGKHFTADDICEMLDKSNNHVGKTTVYRYLEKLLSDGVIRKFTIGDKACACYQFNENANCEHFHLKCIRCAKLIHADCSFLQQLATHIENEHNFLVDTSRTVFYGTCFECREQKQKIASKYKNK